MKKCKNMLVIFIIMTLIIIIKAVLISLMAQLGEIFAFAGLCISIFLLIFFSGLLRGLYVDNFSHVVKWWHVLGEFLRGLQFHWIQIRGFQHV